MISVGGGAGLLAIAVVAAICSERAWVRFACRCYLGLYALLVVLPVVRGNAPPETLFGPALLIMLALYVSEVQRMFASWP